MFLRTFSCLVSISFSFSEVSFIITTELPIVLFVVYKREAHCTSFCIDIDRFILLLYNPIWLTKYVRSDIISITMLFETAALFSSTINVHWDITISGTQIFYVRFSPLLSCKISQIYSFCLLILFSFLLRVSNFRICSSCQGRHFNAANFTTI